MSPGDTVTRDGREWIVAADGKTLMPVGERVTVTARYPRYWPAAAAVVAVVLLAKGRDHGKAVQLLLTAGALYLLQQLVAGGAGAGPRAGSLYQGGRIDKGSGAGRTF